MFVLVHMGGDITELVVWSSYVVRTLTLTLGIVEPERCCSNGWGSKPIQIVSHIHIILATCEAVYGHMGPPLHCLLLCRWGWTLRNLEYGWALVMLNSHGWGSKQTQIASHILFITHLFSWILICIQVTKPHLPDYYAQNIFEIVASVIIRINPNHMPNVIYKSKWLSTLLCCGWAGPPLHCSTFVLVHVGVDITDLGVWVSYVVR
jgi:hypothetical protein